MKTASSQGRTGRRLAATLLAVTVGGTMSVLGAAPAAAAVPVIPAGLPAGIEGLSPYIEETSCEWVDKPGSVALGNLLRATYPGTSYGVSRPCTGTMRSEHYDGRAVDWMNTIRKPAQAAQATAVLQWFFGTDAAGNQFANARRLGIMYIIWNNQIWGSYSQSWKPYQDCAKHPEAGYDTTCHRDHMHLSLSWAGAMRRTSYWTKQVAAVDYGPCRPADLNYAAAYTGPNPNRCPSYPAVTAPAGSSASYVGLVKFSGAVLRSGNSGAPVTALQTALGLAKDGAYGPKTAQAVVAFQKSHGVSGSGVVDATTWRALLAAYRPAVKPVPKPVLAPDITPVALGVVASGSGETVYVRGTDNQVWYRDVAAGSDGDGWRVLTGLVGSGPDAATAPVSGSDRPTTHYLVARSATTSLLYRVRTGTTGQAPSDGVWTDLGGGLTSATAIARTGSGALLAIGRGRDGAAWIRTSTGDGASWRPWKSLGGGFSSALDATPAGTGFLVTGRGGNGVLYKATVNAIGVVTAGWTTTGQATTSGPAATTSGAGAVSVFSRVAGNGVAAWPGGRSYGGALTSAPGASVRGSGTTATTVLVGRNPDGTVWSSQNGGAWRSLGGSVQ